MQDIESLRANVSVLEQRVMELQGSTNTTIAPTGEPVAPTVEPEMAVFEDIRVVNFSECRIANGSCEVVSSGCSINFRMVPEVSCMLCVPTLCGDSPHSSLLAHVVVPECISV